MRNMKREGGLRAVKAWIADLNREDAWRLLPVLAGSKWLGLRGVDVDTVLARVPESPDRWATRCDPSLHERGAGIPRIIFQTWKTRHALPPRFDWWSRSFRHHHPDWQYVRWDDADNRAFIAGEFPWFLRYYDGYPREIFRADIVRLFFLFRFGGLYADLDTQCLRPLDADLAVEGVVLGRINNDGDYAETYLNAIMASSPGELFWLLAIAIAMEKYASLGTEAGTPMPERYTGPFIITEAAHFYLSSTIAAVRARAQPVIDLLAPETPIHAGRLHVLPRERWCPLNWLNRVHTSFRREISRRDQVLPERWLRWLFPRSTLLTYWAHSWD